MKKIIFVSLLILSFNSWAEDTYLTCDCFFKEVRIDIDTLREKTYYSGDCQSNDTKKIAVVLNKEKKYLSYPGDYISPCNVQSSTFRV